MHRIVWVEYSGATGLLSFATYDEAKDAFNIISDSPNCAFARWFEWSGIVINQYVEPV